MGVVYTGNGYDIVNYLVASWNATKALGTNRDDFKKNCDWIRVNPVRGVCGPMDMNNEYQEALHFPNNGFGNQGGYGGNQGGNSGKYFLKTYFHHNLFTV